MNRRTTMKLKNLYIAIAILVAMIVFNANNAFAQVTPDSVNGYTFLSSSLCTSDVHFTQISPVHIQGKSGQAFTFNITSWNFHDTTEGNLGVRWEKQLDTNYSSPTAVECYAKIISTSHNGITPWVAM